jgi:hypothetical protein
MVERNLNDFNIGVVNPRPPLIIKAYVSGYIRSRHGA